MLGWFKKKFGSKVEPEVTEPDLEKAAAAEAVPSPATAAQQAESAAENPPAHQVVAEALETSESVQEVAAEQPVGEDLGAPLVQADAFIEVFPSAPVASEPSAAADSAVDEPGTIAPAQEKTAAKSMFKRLIRSCLSSWRRF
jgi:hypothetical protein